MAAFKGEREPSKKVHMHIVDTNYGHATFISFFFHSLTLLILCCQNVILQPAFINLELL